MTQQTHMVPRFVTVEEAATLLHLSERQVYRMLASGELPVVSFGRARRISRRRLDEYIQALEDDSSGAQLQRQVLPINARINR